MAATPGMIEITPKTTPKIAPTSIATSLGTPDPATTTTTTTLHVTSDLVTTDLVTTDLVTTDLETISRNKRSALTRDIQRSSSLSCLPTPHRYLRIPNSIRGSLAKKNARKTIERRPKIAHLTRHAIV